MTLAGFVRFIARRLLALAVILVLISFAVFSLLYIAPGNAVDILLECESAFADPVSHGRHLSADGIAAHRCPESNSLRDCDPSGSTTGMTATGVSVRLSSGSSARSIARAIWSIVPARSSIRSTAWSGFQPAR